MMTGRACLYESVLPPSAPRRPGYCTALSAGGPCFTLQSYGGAKGRFMLLAGVQWPSAVLLVRFYLCKTLALNVVCPSVALTT